MTQTTIIILIAYMVGVAASRWMQRVEFESEGKQITKGLHAMMFALSCLSWLTVLFLLVAAWIGMIGTEYWGKPVNDAPEVQAVPAGKKEGSA